MDASEQQSSRTFAEAIGQPPTGDDSESLRVNPPPSGDIAEAVRRLAERTRGSDCTRA